METQKQIDELKKQIEKLTDLVNDLSYKVDQQNEREKDLHKIRRRNLLQDSKLLSASDVMEILQITKNTLTAYIDSNALIPVGNARGMKRMFRKVDIKKSFAPELLAHYGSWDKVPKEFLD